MVYGLSDARRRRRKDLRAVEDVGPGHRADSEGSCGCVSGRERNLSASATARIRPQQIARSRSEEQTPMTDSETRRMFNTVIASKIGAERWGKPVPQKGLSKRFAYFDDGKTFTVVGGIQEGEEVQR